MTHQRFLLKCLGLLLATVAQAKTFRTNFIKLELPPGWDCKREELDYTCQPENLADRSEVLMVIVTKEKNEVDDNLKKYEEVLRAPKNMRDLLGNSYQSKVVQTRTRPIRGHDWVDSLQQGSEIPGFYTRYVATTKDKIAALVTYSIAETVYAKWSKPMDDVIESMEIFFDPKAFSEALKSNAGSLLGARGGSSKNRFAPKDEEENPTPVSEGGLDPKQLVAILAALGVVAYVLYKRKRKS